MSFSVEAAALKLVIFLGDASRYIEGRNGTTNVLLIGRRGW